MPLPIFLRPLLLIQYYWQTLVFTLNRWLQRSNDELFGPLEQIIVAVVVTGIAMNPSMVMNLGGPVPVGVPYPIPVPQYQPAIHVPPAAPAVDTPASPPPPATSVNETTSSIPDGTTNGSGVEPLESANTGYAWLDILLDLLPPSYRPNPITIALLIMTISLLIHVIPDGFVHRLRESWTVFWPPWQDRSNASRSFTSTHAGESRSRSPSAPDTVEGNSKSSKDGETKAKAAGSESRAIAEVKSSDFDTEKLREKEKERERAKRKALALAEYEAKKSTASKSRSSGDPPEATVSPTTKVATADTVTQPEKARSVKDDTPPGSKSVKEITTIDPIAPDSEAVTTTADPNDPLMAGDYRPLRSVLKKTTKKPRQSKNVHHNLFMTMRGHQPHLIPFPHGLHPPPHEARHTLWWKNIPKESRHLMAPPPPPKAVKDDPEEEEEENGTKMEKTEVKVKEDGIKEVKVVVDGKKEDDKEQRVKPTESEVRAKVKEKEAEKKASTSGAVARIELSTEPDVPVDPQVQKATWASQAMLCLLLFHIQQQLGLILLAFFVWQQLNTHAEGMEKLPKTRPIAVAEAVAEAPPVRRKEDEIPKEMREKLDRAEQQKSKQSTPETKAEKVEGAIAHETVRGLEKGKTNAVTVEDEDGESKVVAKVEKGKGKERAILRDPAGSAGIELKEKMKGMSPEDRKKHQKYLTEREQKAREVTEQLQPDPHEAKTKAEPRVLSKGEKEAYYRAKATAAPTAEAESGNRNGNGKSSTPKVILGDKDGDSKADAVTIGDKGKEKKRTFEDLTDEEKKKFLLEREKREKRKLREAESYNPTKRDDMGERNKKFEDLTDDEKRRYLREREKGKAKEAERVRRGSRGEGGSGLTASEKETL